MSGLVPPNRLPTPPRVPRRQLEVRFGPYGAIYMVGKDARVVSSFPLDKPVITVGGDFSNDIRVVHESVPRFHFKITYEVNTRTSYILPLCRVALPVDRVLVSPDNTTGLGYPLQHGSRILIGRREFYFMHGKEKTSPRPSAPLPKTRGGSVRTFRLSVIPARDLIPCDPSKEQQMAYPLLPEVAKSTVYVPTLQPEHLPRKPPSTLLAVVSNTLVRMLRRGNDDVEDLNESDLFFGMTQDNADFVTMEEVEEDLAARARVKDMSPECDSLRHRLVRRIIHHLQQPHLQQTLIKQGFMIPPVPPRHLASTVPATIAASHPIPTPEQILPLPAQTESNVPRDYRPLIGSRLNPHWLPKFHQESKAAPSASRRRHNFPKAKDIQIDMLRKQTKPGLMELEGTYRTARLAWQNGEMPDLTPLQADYARMRILQEHPSLLQPMRAYREEHRDNRGTDDQGVPQDTPRELGNPVMMEVGQHQRAIRTAPANNPNHAFGINPPLGVKVSPQHGMNGYWLPNGTPTGLPYGSPLGHFGSQVGPFEAPTMSSNEYAPVDQNMDLNTYVDVEPTNANPSVDLNINPNLLNYQDAAPSSPPVHPGSPMDEDSPGWSARQTQQDGIPILPALYPIDQNFAQGVPLGEFPAHRQDYQQQHHRQFFSLIQQPQDQQELVNKAFLQEWRAKQDQPRPQFHGQGEAGRSYSQGGGLFDHHAQQLDPTQQLTAGDVEAQVLEGSPFVTAAHTEAPETAEQKLYTFYHNLGASGRVRMPPDHGTRAKGRNARDAGTKRLGVIQEACLKRFHPYTRPAKPKVKQAKPATPWQANSSAAITPANTVPTAVTPIPTSVSDVAPSIVENSHSEEEALEVAVASPVIELQEKVAVLLRSSESGESIVAYDDSLHQGSHQPTFAESGMQQFASVPAQEIQFDAETYLPHDIPAARSSSSDEFPPLAPAQTASKSITDITDILNSFDAPAAVRIPDIVLNDETNLLDQATEAADHQTPEITATITALTNTDAGNVQQGPATVQVISSGADSLVEVETSLSQLPDGDLSSDEDLRSPADHAEKDVAAIVDTAVTPEISRPEEEQVIPATQDAEKKAEREALSVKVPTVDVSKKPVRAMRAGKTAAIIKPSKPTPSRGTTRKTAPIEAARQEVLQDVPDALEKAKASGRVRKAAKPSAVVQVAPAEVVEQVEELLEEVQDAMQENVQKEITGNAKSRRPKNGPAAEVTHTEIEVPAIQEVEAVAAKEQIGEEMPVDVPKARITDGANEPEPRMIHPSIEDLAVAIPGPKHRGYTTKSASVAQASASIARHGKRKVDDIAPEPAEEELRPGKITRTVAGRQAEPTSAEPKTSSTTGDRPCESSDTAVTDARDVQAARRTKSVRRGRKTAAAKTVESSDTQDAFLASVEVPVMRRRTISAGSAAIVISLAVPDAEVGAGPRLRTRSFEIAVKASASQASAPTRTCGGTRSSGLRMMAASEEPEVVEETRPIKPLRRGRSMGLVAPESSSEPASTLVPGSGRGVKQAANAMMEESMQVEPEPAPAPRRSCRLAGKAEAVASQPAKSSRKRSLPVDEDGEPAAELSEERGAPIPTTYGPKAAAAVVERGDKRPSPRKKSRTAEAPEAVKRVLPKRAAATRGRRVTPSVTAQPEPVIEESTDKENAVTPAKTARTRALRAVAVAAEPATPTRVTRSQARK